MRQEDSTEYLAAFVVGAVVGIGAALLVAPRPTTRRERIMNELKPYKKKVGRGAARARRAVSVEAPARADKLVAMSRAVVDDMRDEVAAMVAEARADIADSVADQLRAAQKRLEKTAKRVRS